MNFVAGTAEELLALEEKNLREGLSSEERDRWRELTEALFALPQDHVEQRRFFRVQSAQQARVLGPCADENATIRSLSAGGMFVQTPSVPPIGTAVDIEVTIPYEGRSTVTLRGLVKWRAKGGASSGRDPAGFGVSFMELDEQQRRAILALLKEHVQRNVQLGLEKYTFFFDCSPDFTVLVDRHNGILDCNDLARELLGFEPGEDLSERPLLGAFAAPTAQDLELALDYTRTQGHPGRCELELEDPRSGAALRFDVRTAEVRSSDIHLGALIVGRDISDRVRIDQQRRELERRLYHADKLATLGQIVAGVAHDVNNPLAWVYSNVVLLDQLQPAMLKLVDEEIERKGRGAVSDDVRELRDSLSDVVRESIEGATRIRDIIRDLKTFSRMDAQLQEDVDINRALDVTVRIVRNQIVQRAHVVREYGDIPTTYLNFGKVTQIFMNLLANAVRCFRTAEVERNTITIRTSLQDQCIHASIRDNGPGIPAHLHEKIFEPFFPHGWEGGTGLGLPIVRDAARAIGGEIRLWSEPGQGTEFTVVIPVSCRASKPPSSRARRARAEATRPALLIVDDEVVLLRSLERLLHKRFEVAIAANAAAALERLQQQQFDVILCDVMMPDQTGLALFDQAIRLDPSLESRFIFMTGGVFGEQERRALEPLANPIFEKPLHMAQLEDLLAEFVSR